MTRPILLLLLLGVVSLAGCAGDSGAPATTSSSSTSSTGETPMPPEVVAPTLRHIDWNGSLVAGAWWCDSAATHQCMAHPAGSFGTQQSFPGLLGNITSGTLTLTWMAGPLTQNLVIEAIVWTQGCNDCNVTFIPAKSGSSPLTYEVPAGTAIAGGEELLVVVYNGQYTSANGITVGTSDNQAFRVAGDLTLQT